MKFKSKLNLLIIIFLSLPSFLRADKPSIFQIQNIDIMNSLNSSNSGDWEVTDEELNPTDYYKKWVEGFEDTIYWKSYSVPGNISLLYPKHKKVGFKVFIKKEFTLPKDGPTKHISLYIRRISDRDRTYLNGVLIGKTGEFDTLSPQAPYFSRLYDIPNEILRKGDKNLILIEVQNYFENQIGIINADNEIGPSSEIYSLFENRENSKLFFSIIYFIISFTFLFLYYFRKDQLEYLFYALFNLSFAFFQFNLSDVISRYGIPQQFTWYATYISIQFSFVFMTQFVQRYFKFNYSYFQKLLDFISFIIIVSILLKQDLNFNVFIWLRIQIPLGLIYILTFLYFILKRLTQHDRDARFMLISLSLVVPVILNDFLINYGFVKIPQILSPIFILFFDGSLAIILSLNIEKMKREILDLNQNLEKKVLQRTDELNESLLKVQKLKVSEDYLHYLIGINLSNSVNEIQKLSELLVQLEFIGEEERLNVVSKINHNTNELSLTLENLIAWTKLNTNQLDVSIAKFQIKDIFTQKIGIVKELAASRKVNLKFEIQDKEITSDLEILSFIIRKIITNAIEFSNENGNVLIKIQIIDSMLVFICKDEGKGMDIEKAKKLETDIELDSLDQNKINTGLGLKITNRYIKKLNGKLKIISEIGKGTEVVLNTPVDMNSFLE
jgi:signal transduction histidine kinase